MPDECKNGTVFVMSFKIKVKLRKITWKSPIEITYPN
jgi:hypothetical protein